MQTSDKMCSKPKNLRQSSGLCVHLEDNENISSKHKRRESEVGTTKKIIYVWIGSPKYQSVTKRFEKPLKRKY